MNTLLEEKTSLATSLSEDQAVEIVKKALDSAGIPYEERPDERSTPPSFLNPADFDDTPKKCYIQVAQLAKKHSNFGGKWVVLTDSSGAHSVPSKYIKKVTNASASPSRDAYTKKKATRRLEMK